MMNTVECNSDFRINPSKLSLLKDYKSLTTINAVTSR